MTVDDLRIALPRYLIDIAPWLAVVQIAAGAAVTLSSQGSAGCRYASKSNPTTSGGSLQVLGHDATATVDQRGATRIVVLKGHTPADFVTMLVKVCDSCAQNPIGVLVPRALFDAEPKIRAAPNPEP